MSINTISLNRIALFDTTLNILFNSISYGYFAGTLEIYMLSPMGLRAFLISQFAWGYLVATLKQVVALLIGFTIFGITLPNANLLPAIVIFAVAMLSAFGLGLIGASTFSLLNCKGYSPVTWINRLLSTVFSGQYFPVTVLPAAMQVFSFIIPQTYLMRSFRLALLGGQGFENPIIVGDIFILAIFAVILIFIGYHLFKISIRKAEKDGSLSVWK